MKNSLKKIFSAFFIFYFVVLQFSFLILPKTAEAAIISRPPTNLGLVGYWPMDEGSGTVVGDSSGNGNNGNAVGSTWVNGKLGKSLNFSSTSYLSVADNDILDITDTLTISFWIKGVDSGNYVVLEKSNDNSNYHFQTTNLEMSSGGKYIFFGISSSNFTGRVVSNVEVMDNRWHHIVGTFDTNINTLKIFIDGNLSNTNSSASANLVAGNQNLLIGSRSGSIGFPNSVSLDDIRIYNRALSATEISKLYSVNQALRKQVSNSGLVGYWSFNEGGGTKVNDGSGNGNIGTVSGSTWINGKIGGGLNFNGTSDNVSLGTKILQQFDEFTVALWVKAPSKSAWQALVERSIWNWDDGFALNLTSNGTKVSFGHFNDYVTSLKTVQDNKWHHVVGVGKIEGGVIVNYIYVDGVYDNQRTTSRTVFATQTSGGTSIGSRYGGPYYVAGSIDDVRIYNRALSATEIKNLYKQTEAKVNSSQNGKLTNGLVGLWSFDGKDISGTTAYDRSGSGRNGSISGAMLGVGKVGQGLNFDGVTNFISSSGFSEIGASNQSYTFSAWVKINPEESQGDIVHTSSSSNGTGWCLAPLKINNSKVESTSWDTNEVTVLGNTTLNPNVWYHIASSWSPSGLKVYVNGVLDNSTPQTTYSASGGSNYVFVGGSASGSGFCAGDRGYFSGSIDEVRVYNRSLSDSEIKQLYLIGK